MRLSYVSTLVCVPVLLGCVGSASAVLIRDHRDPSIGGGAYSLQAKQVYEKLLPLQAGKTITCETRNASPGADPVLHLLAPSQTYNGAMEEVSRDDDSAGALNARLSYTVRRSGTYLLLLRAAGTDQTGTADLYCENVLTGHQVPVGGTFKELQFVRAGETMTTVQLPQGPGAQLVYVFDEMGGVRERYAAAATGQISFGAGTLIIENVMVGTFAYEAPGPMRLVRNDAALHGHDADGDGLGDELEAQIGTCSNLHDTVGGWSCARSTDPRDTDGDGLLDSWELLGIATPSSFQTLPRWGADPRHKDLFIEVDSRSDLQGDADHVMQPSNALAFAQIYGDPEQLQFFRVLHAQMLGNPDVLPGIHVHLDTGLNPVAGAPALDWTTYGNWGGHNIVPAVCSGGTCHADDAGNVWKTMMAKGREGIFHYALGYNGSGGQASQHTIALNFPINDGPLGAHEFGHTLGMDHSGPQHTAPDANCKPNYPSIMSYAYLDNGGFVPQEFSDGYGRTPLNDVSLTEQGAVPANSLTGQRYLQQLRDVLHFNVDVTTGSVDWDHDGVFSPGTVRAYANDNGDCEFTRVNAMTTQGLSKLAPAIARLTDKTMIFYVDERDNKIWIDYTKDDLSCPGLEGRCGPPLTHQSVNVSWNHDIRAVDVHPIVVGGAARMLMVFRTDTGLFSTTVAPDLSWGSAQSVPIRGAVLDEFSLTGNGDHTILAYKNAAGQAVFKVRHSSNGVWDGDEMACDAAGTPLPALAAGSSPGILEAVFGDGSTHLLAALPINAAGNLRVYVQDNATGRWGVSPWSNSEEATTGKPALAWVPVSAASPMPGRLRILSLQAASGLVRMRSLEAIGLGVNAVVKLVAENFDNDWYYGKGVALLFEGGNSNLRAVVGTALLPHGQPAPHSIELRPKADGVVDFAQKNANDWLGLGVDLCRVLNGSVSGPLKCPDWPF